MVESLSLLDLSAYLMLDGSPIQGLPTIDPLPGLALALGGEATVDWGLKSDVLKLYWYADAAFHLGVSLTDPALLVGLVEIEGGLVVKVFGFGFDLGVYARLAGKAPEPFELTGEVGVDINLPWPFDDIHTSVDVTFGPGGTLPDAPDPFVECSFRPRRQKDARTIPERTNSDVPKVPVDPVFALAFDAPIGNDGGTIDSFDTGGDDYDPNANPRVWKVVTTEQAEKAGVERRHQIGYRYELTRLELIDEAGETVTDLPAAWPPGTPGGEPGELGALAPGGQAPRNTLLLFTHEATYLNRTVGVGGELSEQQLKEWNPCRRTKPQPRQVYDFSGLSNGDRLTEPRQLTLENRPTLGDPPVWGRATDAGSAQARRQIDAEMVPGQIVTPPYDPDDITVGSLKRDRVLGIPRAIARTPRGANWAEQSSVPPVDPVDIVLPAHEYARITVLMAEGVDVRAVGLIDGLPATDRLEFTPVGESFALGGLVDNTPTESSLWQVYTATTPAPVDAIRLYALSGPSPGVESLSSRVATNAQISEALKPMAASLLSVELRFGEGPGTANGELEAVTDLYSDLVSKTLAGDPDPSILEPDTKYTLSATVTAHHAEQWGEDPIELGEAAGEFDKTFTFRTAAEPPTNLRRSQTLDRTRDDWEVYVRPGGSVPAYLTDDIELLFRDTRLLSVYDAHETALALRVVDQHGVDQFEQAATVEQRASELPAEQSAWREKLSSLHCVAGDTDELWREATASITSLLEESTSYTATLHAVDENATLESVVFETAPEVCRFRFTTSRWTDAGAHLKDHRPIDELTEALPDGRTLWGAVETAATDDVTDGNVTIDDRALDEIIHNTLGLPPRRPPTNPELIRIWHWDADTDTANPVAILFDGSEPLLRSKTTVTVRQRGRDVAGHIVTGTAGARVLFVPDDGEFTTGEGLEIELEVVDKPIDPDERATTSVYTHSLVLPTQPPRLDTDGGQP